MASISISEQASRTSLVFLAFVQSIGCCSSLGCFFLNLNNILVVICCCSGSPALGELLCRLSLPRLRVVIYESSNYVALKKEDIFIRPVT